MLNFNAILITFSYGDLKFTLIVDVFVWYITQNAIHVDIYIKIVNLYWPYFQ